MLSVLLGAAGPQVGTGGGLYGLPVWVLLRITLAFSLHPQHCGARKPYVTHPRRMTRARTGHTEGIPMKIVTRSAAAIALIFASMAAFFVSPASAHSAGESYVYLNVTETALDGRVDLPFTDLREVLGFELNGTDEQNAAELESRVDELAAFADTHLDINGYDLSFGELDFLFEEEEDLDFAILPYVADTRSEEVPRVFEVTFDPFVAELDRNVLVIIQNDWKAGIYDNGEGQISSAVYTFSAGNETQTIDLGDSSWWQNFKSSLALGLDHIRTGPDHILFVLVLLLPSVLVFGAGGWKPSDNYGASLWRVLKIVTMFTVAHSITFSLAGLGILPLPDGKITESIIALSIAAAALHNLRPIFPNREWVIAFVFGLFHGMGFASLVSGIEVDRNTQLVSLLGRNIGIEIGQAVVILVCFTLLYLLRNTVLYRWVMMIGSAVLTLVALLWMYERLFEQEVGIGSLTLNSMVEKFTRYPRSVYVIAALTVVAAGIQMYERRNDRLVDTVDLPTIDTDDSDERELVEV